MIINDNYYQAEKTLREVNDLLNYVLDLEKCFISFEQAKEENPELTYNIFRRNVSMNLLQKTKFSFKIKYPNLSLHFNSGDGDEAAFKQLSSAIITLADLHEKLKNNHFLIRSTEDRDANHKIVISVIRNLLLYLVEQYHITAYETEIYLPVKEFVERDNLGTVESYCEHIMALITKYKAEFYIYDRMSDASVRFMNYDAALYAAIEDCRYPLTESMAEEMLDDINVFNAVAAKVDKYSKVAEFEEVADDRDALLNKLCLG